MADGVSPASPFCGAASWNVLSEAWATKEVEVRRRLASIFIWRSPWRSIIYPSHCPGVYVPPQCAHLVGFGRLGVVRDALHTCSGMNTRQLGLEPLMGVEELAGYFGVPVQTVYDWRVAGTAPRAFKFGKRLKSAVSDVQSWLAAHQEVGPKDVHSE